eukprot:TRINITY_DN12228_c1_g3_i1.p1 TRINITY_DN12228_c1_g3~~TRINITY_DN12228_c1_g3_i1.p1  ORF type:complete len:208 (+),score=37.80 TRINITY_DN12228_c1_g3_i1:324-947(+)
MITINYQRDMPARDQFEQDHPTAPAPSIPRTSTSLPIRKLGTRSTSAVEQKVESYSSRFFGADSPSMLSQASTTSFDSGAAELSWEPSSPSDVFSSPSSPCDSPSPVMRRPLKLNVHAPDFKPQGLRYMTADLEYLSRQFDRLSTDSSDSMIEDDRSPLTPAEVKHALPAWMCTEVCQMKTRKTRRGCRGHRRNRRRKSATLEQASS